MKNINFIAIIFFCFSISADAQPIEMPYSFRENKGQIKDVNGQRRQDIDFSLQAPGLSIMVGDGQMHYQFSRLEGGMNMDSIRNLRTQVTLNKTELPYTSNGERLYRTPRLIMNRLDVTLIGSNKNAIIIREDEHAETYNYYDPASRQNGMMQVKTFGKITYKDIYPHIDWILYTKNGELKYDFIVRPGGKVSDIKMQYEGADSMRITDNGSLRINTPAAVITEQAPVAFEQAVNKSIAVKYVLDQNIITFKAATYNGTLIIDPGVDWATYAGGNGGGEIYSVTTDQNGGLYVTGSAMTGVNFITSGAHQVTMNGYSSSFIAKFNSNGTLDWGTYYTGTGPGPYGIGGYTLGSDIACDQYGHVYLVGITWCDSGIATPGSFQDTFSLNSGGLFSTFLAQFTETGSLNWATYYGASSSTPNFLGVSCDGLGNVYAAGQADSSTSTTFQLISPGAWQSNFGGGISDFYYNDGLLVKFDSSGNRLWATYYGGEGNDFITGITCDSIGNLYIVGSTNSANGISTPNTFEPVMPDSYISGLNQENGGFVAKFSSSGQRIWGTYLNAVGDGVAVSKYGHLYISGTVHTTADSSLASPGAYLMYALSPRSDFLMRLDTATGQRSWGTYYGGEFEDGSNTGYVSCDAEGNVFLAGTTNSRGLPGSLYVMATPGSHQDTLNAPPGLYYPNSDLYIAKFDSTGRRKWGTYYGGVESENVGRTAIDHSLGAIYLVGYTNSTGAIATSGAFQESLEMDGNGFIVKFLPLDLSLDSLLSPVEDTLCSGTYPFSIRVSNKGKMDKTDALDISYSYTGATNGSGSFSYTSGLPVGAVQTIDLGSIALDAPGWYDFTVYLHYTQDDDDFDNDTLHFSKFVVAPPVAGIDAYFIGNTFYFSNSDTQSVNTYAWEFGDGGSSTAAAPNHTYPAQNATYTVLLTISNACGSDTASVQVQGDGTGLHEAGIARQLKLYPNPATTNVHLESNPGVILQSYALVNSAGSVVKRGALDKQHAMISLQQLPAGIYLLKVQTSQGVAGKKLVVND